MSPPFAAVDCQSIIAYFSRRLKPFSTTGMFLQINGRKKEICLLTNLCELCFEYFTNHANALDKNVYVHLHSLPSGSRIRPARRPVEMATADSPKDGEPPTVSGMPSEFQYTRNDKKCQIQTRQKISIGKPVLFCRETTEKEKNLQTLLHFPENPAIIE